MRILVTGGAGFIGVHLCKRLLEQGHTVLCLDNLSTSAPGALDDISRELAFRLYEQDVVDALDFQVDAIYNLACPASPVRYQADPLNTLRTSTVGMDNVLQCALRYGSRVVQTSTSEVYGSPDVHPQTEVYWGNVNPYGPRSCYDEGKRCAETLCYEYSKLGVDARVARIFNTYGPGMDPNDGRVVSNLVTQALRGESVTLYGTGEQTRSFCYVSDMVDALIALMGIDDAPRTPVNLGNPVEVTMRSLASTIAHVMQKSLHVKYLPLPTDDPPRRCPDIALAEELLGWAPSVTLHEGLQRTIAYFSDLA